jgi:dTDP-4-amino-4,6-dideoxygalactose transaminase
MAQTNSEAAPFLPFAAPDIGEEEIAEVVHTLRGGWLTTANKTRQFETDFSAYVGGMHAISVNSATAGLHLALEALGVGPGDEVITSTLTFTATAEVARYLGADVKFVDVLPSTLNLDPDAVEAAVTSRTKVIIPVHYAGLAADMGRILEISHNYGLAVVEDAAHALPTTYKGALVGSLRSSATVFSFYANKTITTGEGGMVTTSDANLAERMRVMRLHGMSKDAFDRYSSQKPAWYYEIVAPGYKYNLTDIASSLGIHQLRKLPRFWEHRQWLADQYFEALAGLPLVLPARALADDKHAWHLFVVRLDDACQHVRDEVIMSLANHGIGTSVHYIPLHRQPYWRDRYNLSAQDFPVADFAYQKMISLPLYTRMSGLDVQRVARALRDILT